MFSPVNGNCRRFNFELDSRYQVLTSKLARRKDNPLPQVNYKHEKRQRELEKKKQKDQKIKSKMVKKPVQTTGAPETPAEK
jgi:hypothetical protein